jgi:hypothetical protein
MQSLTEAIHRLSYEVFDEDSQIFAPGTAKSAMRETIGQLSDSLEEIVTQLAPNLPPATSKVDPIYVFWRRGACFKDRQEDCDSENYNPSVGFTKDLATSGLEQQIFTFIETSNSYLNERQYLNQTDSKAFKLIDYLNTAFYTDFRIIVRELNIYSERSTIVATVALFGLATLVLTSFGFMYYIGFMETPRKYSAKNRLLISLVYSISPADRAKNHDLQTFVESCGASVN